MLIHHKLCRTMMNLTWRQFALSVCLLTIVFNEYLVYYIQSLRWPAIPLRQRDPSKQLVILLISDPQLQGYENEQPFPLGTITRWDSDRYLRTFDMVYSYVRPDVIIYLGDLMDEGSTASDSDYITYYNRFKSIYSAASGIKNIYIPGDNDIGGEGRDIRTKPKSERYEQHFGRMREIVTEQFVDFVKLDVLISSTLKLETLNEVRELSSHLTSPVKIVINHATMIPKGKPNLFPIVNLIRPTLIISGHHHTAHHLVCEDCMGESSRPDDGHWKIRRVDQTNITDFVHIDLSNPVVLNELLVPTCSYRMGVPNIGYGVAIIGSDTSLLYTILWLPSRYVLLGVYVVMLVMIAVSWLVCRCFCRPNRNAAFR